MRKIFNTENLICLTTALLPAYLIRFRIFGVPTNVLEMLILFTALVYFSQPTNRQLIQKYVPEYVLGYILPISLLLTGLLLSIAANENWRTGLGILKGWFILPLLFALIVMIKAKDGSVKEKILKALYFSAFGVSLAALSYFFAGKLTYDGRLAAFYLSPNHLAMFLAPGLIFGIWYLVFSAKNFEFKSAGRRMNLKLLFYFASFLAILTAFYFTYSYAAWASVIASLVIVKIITQSKNQNKLLVTCYGLLVTFLLLSIILLTQWHTPKFQDLIAFDERSSLASRIMIWKSAAKIAADNPFLGIGPGNFQSKYLEYQKFFPYYLEWAVPQPHNLYLAFWLQGGLLGFLGFARLATLWIKRVSRLVRQEKGAFLSWETALLGVMLYILLHGLFDTTYWKNDLSVIFWIIFALGMSVRQTEAKPAS